MITSHLSITGILSTRKKKTEKNNALKKQSKSYRPIRLFIKRISVNLREVNDYANSVGMLVEEANERAKKPWNQCQPVDSAEKK